MNLRESERLAVTEDPSHEHRKTWMLLSLLKLNNEGARNDNGKTSVQNLQPGKEDYNLWRLLRNVENKRENQTNETRYIYILVIEYFRNRQWWDENG